MSLPPLHAVRVFEAAARHLSMSAAARELYISQGAVSQQIKNLEGYLGTELFMRRPAGLALTEAGELFQQTVSPAIRAIQLGTSRVRRFASDSEIVISTVGSVAARWLLPRISRLEADLGATRVRIDISRGLVDFSEHAVDLAIRYGKGQWEGTESRLLFRLNMVLVAAPDLVAGARGSGVDLVTSGRMPLLNDRLHGYWAIWCDRHGIEEREIADQFLFIDDLNVLIDVALNGQGIALVPTFLIRSEIASNRLMLLEEEPIDLEAGLWMVTAAGGTRRKKVDELMRWLEREAGADTGELRASSHESA